jgi:hypothetical protein
VKPCLRDCNVQSDKNGVKQLSRLPGMAQILFRVFFSLEIFKNKVTPKTELQYLNASLIHKPKTTNPNDTFA